MDKRRIETGRQRNTWNHVTSYFAACGVSATVRWLWRYYLFMSGLTWDQSEEIALALQEKHPEADPLTVRFTDLHKWVTALPDFGDDPLKSSEGKLEAIQMAWLEEYKDSQ
jgi:FeS assembly protein IscX